MIRSLPDPAVCYRALETRDPRFDGHFYTAVISTGVFCRPICPARTPKPGNCRFYASAAAAFDAGFRPCLRCRPETSPGAPAWQGTSATVSRAMRLLEGQPAGDFDAGVLAARLGVGERHLRRLFLRHVGATPGSVVRAERILFAKRLLDGTSLPLAEVADAAGFSSARRLHEAIHDVYGKPPRELRRAGGRAPTRGEVPIVELKLPFRPPYHWKALIEFLAPRATPGVEEVGSDSYRRSIRMGDATGAVEVRLSPEGNFLLARIQLPAMGALRDVAERLRRMFDPRAGAAAIAAHLSRDPRLAPAVAAFPGLRLPGAWDPFELAVRAILGQQVSVRAATTLAGKLAAAFGEPAAAGGIDPEHSIRFLFPDARALSRAPIASIGIPAARAEAIAKLATAVANGANLFDPARGLEESVRLLREFPGIGEWTAGYIAMRALSEPDAFPAGDLGLRRALAENGAMPSHAALARRAEAWRPWRAYAALYLWTWKGTHD